MASSNLLSPTTTTVSNFHPRLGFSPIIAEAPPLPYSNCTGLPFPFGPDPISRKRPPPRPLPPPSPPSVTPFQNPFVEIYAAQYVSLHVRRSNRAANSPPPSSPPVRLPLRSCGLPVPLSFLADVTAVTVTVTTSSRRHRGQLYHLPARPRVFGVEGQDPLF